jgi:hypothetical protein
VSQSIDWSTWWNLHLRIARGEALSAEEQQLYDAEVARQDREVPPLKTDIESLKTMREQVLALGRENAKLRSRVEELEREIGRVEHSLNDETRQALGVGE